MRILYSQIPEVFLIEPAIYKDHRGEFFESFNCQRFSEVSGLTPGFLQDNHSKSKRGVLHGLHYQIRQTQAKLVRVVAGEVFDVAVDIRKNSPTFGHWVGAVLSAENKHQMWIPEGFAHGFVVTSESAEFLYKTTDYWAPEHERCIAWNDPAIGIQWPFEGEPVLSEKDKRGVLLADAEVFP